MNTPICDFVSKYSESNALRLHMPGHKGKSLLGIEKLDITEIDGADSLYEADGIIRESERNASSLFGADTFYSTEGSSLCIRAMLFLACLGKKNPSILACRNVHKTFLSAAVMLDFDIKWLYPKTSSSYLSCEIDITYLEEILKEEKPTAFYITSPDYLGNMLDIKQIADVCHKHNTLLLVDNAHGAYLKFLNNSLHPIDLGADICCDSAHKTLPVLTGGAYLHISKNAPESFKNNAKNALALFGSTSPSYLILQSLDMTNKYLAEAYKETLNSFIEDVEKLKIKLKNHGFSLIENEPLKVTINGKKYGYSGNELAKILYENNIVCEFADPDFVVLMLTPETNKAGINQLENVLFSIEKQNAILEKAPVFSNPEKVLPPRLAAFSECETIPANESEGRILAVATVGCPPAVPIVVSGEKIDKNALKCFEYYGIENCTVVKN